MSRAIITKSRINVAGEESGIDDFKDKLIKLIPAEIIGAYLTLKGIIDAAGSVNGLDNIKWIVFLLLVILTPIIYKKIYQVDQNKQLLLTTIAFIIWAFTIGSPLDNFFQDIYGKVNALKGIIASVLLVFYSLTIPLLMDK